MCNGEVYNYDELHGQFSKSYEFQSHSDCEAILPLLSEYGIEECARRLDSEFAFVAYDHNTGKLLAARDPIGIRPLNPNKFSQTELGNGVYAFQYSEAERLDLILLVDTSIDAYAVYWGSNRADKCDSVDWKTWEKQLDLLTSRSPEH